MLAVLARELLSICNPEIVCISLSSAQSVRTSALTHHSTRHAIDMLILDIVVRDDQVVEMPPDISQQAEDRPFVMIMPVVIFASGDHRAVRISRLASFGTGQREGRAGSAILFRLRENVDVGVLKLLRMLRLEDLDEGASEEASLEGFL